VVPLAVGFLAQRFGLSWALASLAAAPVGLLAGLWRPPPAQTVVAARQSPGPSSTGGVARPASARWPGLPR